MSEAQAVAADGPRKKSIVPWVILALWFAWLAALVAMSFPHWRESKKALIEIREREKGNNESHE